MCTGELDHRHPTGGLVVRFMAMGEIPEEEEGRTQSQAEDIYTRYTHVL
jgi:hypothetical protein